MTNCNQSEVFELHVHLCKPYYKSTVVDELLISCDRLTADDYS